MPGHVGQRLGGDVVGADLDRLRQPLFGCYPQVDGDGGAAGECLERGAEAALGQDRRVDAAGGLTQVLERAVGLGDSAGQLRA